MKNLSDVEDLDMIRSRQEKEKGERKKPEAKGVGEKKGGAPNRFHNFEPSGTDYDSLMMEKVRARMKE